MNTNRKTLGLIMDGNRRYSEAHNISLRQGYIDGVNKLKEVCDWAREYGYTDITAFAFAKDNWNRDEVGVDSILDLIRDRDAFDELLKNEDVRIKFIGQIEMFPEDIQKIFKDIEEQTKGKEKYLLSILVSYNGREDLLNAFSKSEHLSAEEISRNLSTYDSPDPECIIRTGDRKRLSSFLLWEAEYAELFFSSSMWPEFSKKEFQSFMKELEGVQKNYGK